MNLPATTISSVSTADVFTLSVITFISTLAIMFIVMYNKLRRK
jgi:hypothetical protein